MIMLNAPGQLVYAFLKKIRFEVSIWLKQEYVHTAERYEAFSFLNETYGLIFLFSHFLIGLQRNLNFS